MEGNRNYSITFLGVYLGTSNWLRATRYVNGCAEGVGKPHPFSRPESVTGGDICTIETYTRASIKIRPNHEAVIYCDSEDKELQCWLEAAKAYIMGLSTSRPPFAQGDSISRI